MVRSHAVAVLCLAGLLLLSGYVGLGQHGAESPTPEETTEAPAPTANGTLEVHVIDVGQSESTLLVGPNETMLVDTGHFADDGETVLRYLRAQGVERIDHLVVTHADADHIGGNAAVIDYYETEADGIGAVYDPGIAASTRTYERYLDAVERHNVTLYEMRAGDRLAFADADVDVLGPPEPYIQTQDRNENSLVFKLTHGNASFLFTGDAGHREEAYLRETYGDRLQSTVLKVGHHGSATSTSEQFVGTVDPVVATISSAYDSQYGHPDGTVLQTLAAHGVTTYWTGTHGTIRFTSDGTQVAIATQQAAPTDPTLLREGHPATNVTAPLQTRAVITLDMREVDTTPETQAVETPAADSQPPVATDGGTKPSQAQLTLVAINADAAGDERANLEDEYLVFENRGETALNLSGWTVQDAAGATYTFPPGVTLQPGKQVTLHTGHGTNDESDLYWNRDQPVWNNDGDGVTVTDAAGEVVLEEAYG